MKRRNGRLRYKNVYRPDIKYHAQTRTCKRVDELTDFDIDEYMWNRILDDYDYDDWPSDVYDCICEVLETPTVEEYNMNNKDNEGCPFCGGTGCTWCTIVNPDKKHVK